MLGLRRTDNIEDSADDGDKGLIQINLTVVTLGIVLTGLLFVALGSNFFLPLIDSVGDAISFGGSVNQSKAVNSAKAMSLAVSCTGIMNAHVGPNEPGDPNIYTDEWETPMNQQGFGSQIAFSCADTVPEDGEPPGEQGAWFAPAERNGVNVVCDGYNASGEGCTIRNFALPQDISYVGPENPLSNNYAQKMMKMWGGPMYVLYYQSAPKRAVQNWQQRGQGMSMKTIAFGIGLEIATLGLGGGASSVATKIGNYISGTRVYRATKAVTSSAASSARSLDAKIQDTLPNVGSAGYRFTKAVARAGMKLASRGPTHTARWISRKVKYASLSFVTRRVSDMPARILRPMIQADVSDEFFERVAREYTDEFMARMQREGMTGIRLGPDGTYRFANNMDEAEWIQRTAQLSDDSLEQAVKDVGDDMFRRADLPVSGDTMWRVMRESSEDTFDAMTISDFSLRQASELAMNVRASGSYIRSVRGLGDDVPGGSLANRIQPDRVPLFANSIQRTNARQVQVILNDVSRGAGSSGIRDAARSNLVDPMVNRLPSEVVSAGMTFRSALSTIAGTRPVQWAAFAGRKGSAGARRAASGIGSFICASPAVQAQVIEEVSTVLENDHPNVADAFQAAGRCGVLGSGSASFTQVCSDMGTGVSNPYKPPVLSGLQMDATKMCGAITFMGYAANRKLAETQYLKPGRVNSMYLAGMASPNARLPLHPIANYYFVRLDRGGNNPDDRFFMASPMETRRIAGADNPRIEVRPGTSTSRMTSEIYANDRLGPGGNSCGGWTSKISDFAGWASGQAQGFTETLFSFGWTCQADTDGDGNDEEVFSGAADKRNATYEQALLCNKKGTYLKTSASCNDELHYTTHPQVRKAAGPGYSLTPDAAVPAPPNVPAYLLEGTHADREAALDHIEDGLLVESSLVDAMSENHSQVPSSQYEDPNSKFSTDSIVVPDGRRCDTVEVAVCEDGANPWECTTGEVVENTTGLHGPWYVELSQTRDVQSAGTRCTQSGSAAPSATDTNNVQQMTQLMGGPDRPVGPEYFRQLWFWDSPVGEDECFNPNNQGGGDCLFDWRNNEGDEPRATGFMSDSSPEMLNMYPVAYPNDYGKTIYHDSATVGNIIGGVTSFLEFQKTTKSKEMRSIIVSVEGAGGNQNWQTDSGNAVYGWNADIESNAWMKAAFTAASVTAAIVATVASGGLLAAGGAAVVGSADVIAQEYVGYASSWPNH